MRGALGIKFYSSVDNGKFIVKIGSFLSKENRWEWKIVIIGAFTALC